MKLALVLSTLLPFGLSLASTVPVRRDYPTVPSEGDCVAASKYLGIYNGGYSQSCGALVRFDSAIFLSSRWHLDIMVFS
jgi:hypothetical protein